MGHGKLNNFGCPRFCQSGFTLIELIVVISLISLMLLFSAPRFQGAMLMNDTRKVSRWIIFKVQLLRQEALKTRTLYTLHVDTDANRLWVTNTAMSEEALDAAQESGYNLPDNVDILDVIYPEDEKIASGQADIQFYPNGYSDKVCIHLEDAEGNPTSLLIEPFLAKVKIRENYVEF